MNMFPQAWRRCLPAAAVLLLAPTAVQAQQDLKVFPGLGRAAVEEGYFGQDKKRSDALMRAERLAVPNALQVALKHALGTRVLPEAKMQEVVKGLADHSATLVRSQQVTEEFIEDGFATVKMAVKVDLKAVTEYLAGLGISLTEQVGGKFKVWVLSFPVEGVDPSADRSKPIVLRDEVKEERQNVQSGSFSNLNVNAASRSQSASLQASQASSDKGSVAVSSSHSLDASAKASASAKGSMDVDAKGRGGSFSGSQSGSAKAESEASLSERSSAAGSADWDKRQASAIDARKASASASYAKTANSGSSYSDTSTKYFRVTEYADPTKKSAGLNNEVRNIFEGMLKRSGLDLATMNLAILGKEFTEDTFLDYVLQKAEVAGAGPDDYLAIVLNRLTPISSGSDSQRKYGATVSYRVIRVRDRSALLEADSVSRESDFLSTDDGARNQATKLALASVDEVLPAQLRRGLQQLNTKEAARSEKLQGKYLIQVEGLEDRSLLVKLKQDLKNAGFSIKSETANAGRTERITVELGAKSAEDVKDVLDGLPKGLSILDKSDREARLKAN